MTRTIEVVLFDVGGVLLDLPGLPGVTTTNPEQQARLWRLWLDNPDVRRFETGQCAALEFAERMVTAWDLTMTPAQYLHAFRSWPRGMFPEIPAIVAGLDATLVTGCLSNSNEIHWPVMWGEMGLSRLVDRQFVSYRLGVAKPDPEIFARVAEDLAVRPAAIFFADDNPKNVAAARAAGWVAAHTVGPQQLRSALSAAGLLP